MQQLNLNIENMTCMQCARRIEIALRQLAGVDKAHVKFADRTATVDFDPEVVSVGTLVSVVREEGFAVGATRTRMAVKGMRCASCVTQVETALTQTPGVVSASVNSATAEVDITYRPAQIDVDGLNQAVEASGYALAPAMEATEDSVDRHAAAQNTEYRGLMKKFWFAAIVSLPVMFFSYPDFIPGLREWMPMGSDNRRIVWGLLGRQHAHIDCLRHYGGVCIFRRCRRVSAVVPDASACRSFLGCLHGRGCTRCAGYGVGG